MLREQPAPLTASPCRPAGDIATPTMTGPRRAAARRGCDGEGPTKCDDAARATSEEPPAQCRSAGAVAPRRGSICDAPDHCEAGRDGESQATLRKPSRSRHGAMPVRRPPRRRGHGRSSRSRASALEAPRSRSTCLPTRRLVVTRPLRQRASECSTEPGKLMLLAVHEPERRRASARLDSTRRTSPGPRVSPRRGFDPNSKETTCLMRQPAPRARSTAADCNCLENASRPCGGPDPHAP